MARHLIVLGVATVALAGCAAAAPSRQGDAPASADYCTDAVETVRDVVQGSATWSGEVVVAADLMVAPGATLAIEPGTVVRVVKAESSKTLPHFLAPENEILVRGRIVARGTAAAPIRFVPADPADRHGWQGIYFEGDGPSVFEHVEIAGVETAYHVLGGEVRVEGGAVRDFTYGVIAQDGGVATVRGTRFEHGETALGEWRGGRLDSAEIALSDVKTERRRDERAPADGFKPPVFDRPHRIAVAKARGVRTIQGTADLNESATWSGYVEIDGTVRVNLGTTLTIAPGTVVAFTRLDTNGDGFGENELNVVGVLRAEGTEDEPILFTSAEAAPAPGDWGAVNFMANDVEPSSMDHVVLEDAYRAVHLHFAKARFSHLVARGNLRAFEFQESKVEIVDSVLYDNRYGAKFRDSQVLFARNAVARNFAGVEAYRTEMTFEANALVGNRLHGLRLKEGEVRIDGCRFVANRRGLLLHDASPEMRGNEIVDGAETGVYAKGSKAVLRGNLIARNGTGGVTLRGGAVDFEGNEVRDNGANGLSIASGAHRVRGNALVGNVEYDLGIDATADVDAAGNWWGTTDPARIAAKVFDRADDARLGRVRVEPYLTEWSWTRS